MTVDLSAGIRADVGPTNRHQIADITGGDTYTAGGETVAPEDFRMGKIFLILGSIWNGTAQLVAQYIPSTGKLIWIDSSTGAQVANGDLSGYTGRVLAIGL